MTLEDIYLLKAIFSWAILMLEFPSGVLADRIGRRRCLIFGQGALLIGWVWYCLAHNFWGFVGAELCLAVGMSLLSGADSSLLHDSLEGLNESHRYAAIESKGTSLRLVVFAICCLIGAPLYDWDPHLPFYATALGPLVGLGLAFGFAEPPSKGQGREASMWKDVWQTAGRVFQHQDRRRLIIFRAALMLGYSCLYFIYQPIMVESGLDVKYFGLFYALMNLATAPAVRGAGVMVERYRRPVLLWSLLILDLLPFGILAFWDGQFALLALLAHFFLKSSLRPILNHYLLEEADGDKSSIISASAFCDRLFFMTASLVLGGLSGFDLSSLIRLEGIVLALILLPLGIWLTRPRPQLGVNR